MGQNAARTLDVSAYIDDSIVIRPAIFKGDRGYARDKSPDPARAWTEHLGITGRIFAPRYVKLHFPRGIAWNDYPVVADAQYRPDFEAISDNASDFCRNILGVVETVGSMGRVIYDERHQSPNDRKARYMTGALIARMFPDVPVKARLRGEDEFLPVSAALLCEEYRASERLRYSYAVNFSAIGHKAIAKVVRQPVPSIPNDQGIQFTNIYGLGSTTMSEFNSLESLQFLFSLRDAAADWLYRCYSDKPKLVLIPDRPGVIEARSWVGSGKYAPVNIEFKFGRFIRSAVGLGLVDVDVERQTAALSDAGNMFLEMMHPDNEDIDAIGRWADPIPIERMQAADDWVLRFFRKMKARVNLLD